MNDIEADDEQSSVDDSDLLFLMDGIALTSSNGECKTTEQITYESLHRRKISNANQNLMNKHYQRHNNGRALKQSIVQLKPLDRWKMAVHNLHKLKDPWRNFDMKNIVVERVERHIFDASTDSWLQPVECWVKIESQSFNRGAMRECYRLKKISSLFKHDCNWKHAGNYVAKRYIEHVYPTVYYEDVKLQMDAKLWGQEYSRQPGLIKKVDICQMSVIKFIDRPGQPLYHLEHFIEGEYIKYNSNSGFVDDNTRNTPQAFSHFTFERSGHKLIVVDIQGVGDLYTDPQIHTFSKTGYGDGNLGPRGMALFFHSHSCNFICEMLVLKKFDLSPTEKLAKELGSLGFVNAGTVAQMGPKVMSVYCETHIGTSHKSLINRIEHISLDDSGQDYSPGTDSTGVSYVANDGDDETSEPVQLNRRESNESRTSKFRSRLSSCENNGHIGFFKFPMDRKPSCVEEIHKTPIDFTKIGECILGEIHHEMARLHNCGKLIDSTITTAVNWEALMFHEKLAATLGCLESIRNLACYFLDLMSDGFFENYPYKPNDEDRVLGLQYMEKAALAGDRRSMIYLADYLRQAGVDQDWKKAYFWYEQAVSSVSQLDDCGDFDSTNDTPVYEITAIMADMLCKGNQNLEMDLCEAYNLYSRAAEEATKAGKGRLAIKWYELAETLSSSID